MVSSTEQCHILYQLGHTLESLGRDAEGLEVYGRISKNYPEFLDVAQRIEHLRASKDGSFSWTRSWWKAWMKEGFSRYQAVSLHNHQSVLDQTGQRLGSHTEQSAGRRR
jgi:hypothetical protein